jgi:signal transduction histidine kinase
VRVRIVLLVGATSSLVLVAFLVPLAILVRSSTADHALGAAVVEAQTLAPLVATGSGDRLARAVAEANEQSAHPVTVFLPDGRVVGATAPETDAVALGRTGQSLTDQVPGGREVIVAVEGLPAGTAVIRSFVPDDELTDGVTRAWTVLALLGLGLLAVSLVVADALARLLTRPLTGVADVAVRLADGALGARALVEGAAEVRQVSAGLNLLAGRITELLAEERATMADLSHRLRTPLTVLRIDLDSVPDPEIRASLVADLDSVDRTLDDIIRDTERPGRTTIAVSCDAAAVVLGRVRFWSVVAEEERRRVTVDVQAASGAIPVRLGADELAACLDALIGNVFAHTRPGTPFGVRLTAVAGGGAVLVVSDEGSGMPSGPVLARGASGGGSTGLGLDIVARAADRSGGAVHIGQHRSGGAEVTVELGPPAPPMIRSHRR